MFGLGMSEIIFLAVLALIVIGPKELPQLARTLGRFINELKRSSNILQDEIKQHVRIDRFDLDSAMSRPKEVKEHEQQVQASSAPTEPQQMDLAEQEQVAVQNIDETNTDSSENKKS